MKQIKHDKEEQYELLMSDAMWWAIAGLFLTPLIGVWGNIYLSRINKEFGGVLTRDKWKASLLHWHLGLMILYVFVIIVVLMVIKK